MDKTDVKTDTSHDEAGKTCLINKKTGLTEIPGGPGGPRGPCEPTAPF